MHLPTGKRGSRALADGALPLLAALASLWTGVEF